ncbi:MAG: S16 family serine protease, partial [Nannocystaceae bacterium]
LPKQLKENGLTSVDVNFTDPSIKELIHYYTKECGVRSLERQVSSISRKLAREYIKDNRKRKAFKVDVRTTQKLLGPHKYRYNRADRADQIGMTNGLAVTIFGGDLLPAEVQVIPGKGKVTLTGKLGEVMQESAQAAITYVRSRSLAFGLEPDFHEQLDFHVHFPEGAVPKDGPSAGVTMVVSLVSAILGVPVRRDVAMTGEINLRGKVLPIGGLKDKILAAFRGQMKTVIVPKDNEKDLIDLPKNVLKAVKVKIASSLDEVLRWALVHPPEDHPNLALKDFLAGEGETEPVNWQTAHEYLQERKRKERERNQANDRSHGPH